MGGWLTPRPGRFTAGNDPVSVVQETWWGPGSVWTGAENLAPTGIRSPDRLARSKSLYRLSHRNPVRCNYVCEENKDIILNSCLYEVPSARLLSMWGRSNRLWDFSIRLLIERINQRCALNQYFNFTYLFQIRPVSGLLSRHYQGRLVFWVNVQHVQHTTG